MHLFRRGVIGDIAPCGMDRRIKSATTTGEKDTPCQIEKLVPQPQEATAFGFLI